MTEEHVESLIPYDDVVQEALRAVVGRVLGDVARDGLPGDHHFYITFKTQAPGVAIPQHLHERFPDEMTIVLQHKYWDLKVKEEHFEVGLSFSQIPSHLFIPYSAITAFVDPAVDFALQFHVDAGESAPEPHEEAGNDGPSVVVEDAYSSVWTRTEEGNGETPRKTIVWTDGSPRRRILGRRNATRIRHFPSRA